MNSNYIREDDPMTNQLTIERDIDVPTIKRKAWAVISVAFLLLFAAWCASAQTTDVPVTAVVQWSNPTTGCTPGVTPCDNVPLGGPTAITELQLFASQATIPSATGAVPAAKLPATATSHSYSTTAPAGATLYFRVRACNAFGCGVLSTEGSRKIVGPLPGSPTGTAVTVTVVIQPPTP
jgi:hypothetical protein